VERLFAAFGGGTTSTGLAEVNERKSETKEAPWAFRKGTEMNMYPVKLPVWPAAVRNSLRRAVQVEPEARTPLESRPEPGRTVALV